MEYPSNSLRGKTVLITGGTGGIGGIGKATALGLAALGAQVVLVGRDGGRGATALAEIRQATGNGALHFLQGDLSVQAEVRRVATTFRQRFTHLHVLVNNVAGVFRHRQESSDGIEATLAIGHLAPFLLTHLLLPALESSAPARIINVASEGHRMAQMDFEDVQARHFYRGIDIYMRVKLATLLFTYELARRLGDSEITVNAVDPGGARTELTAATTPDMLPPMLRLMWPLLARFAFTGVEKAAASSIYAAAAPALAGVSGKYFNPKLKAVPSSKASYDRTAAGHLWQLSAQLTGLGDENVLAA